MRTAALVLAAFLFTGVLSNDGTDGQNNEDDPMKVNLPDDVSDGTNAISRFLGFKCPKGHRCLPVLECLPCDYGFYKEDETSDLCDMCPPSCTTLRKGATSKRECIPKCPTGFEPSDCGKTCTQCRPGYYKSNWRNKACNKCSKKYKNKIDPNRIGMTRHKQCDASQDDPTECGDPTPPANGEVHFDSVDVGSMATVTCEVGYELQNTDPVVCGSDGNWSEMPTCVPEVHQPGACDTTECNWQDDLYMPLDDCQRFCQCTPLTTNADGTTTGYWQEKVCGPGTLFNPQLNPVCDHPENVDCEAGSGGCGPAEIVGGTGDVTYVDNTATVTCHAPYELTGPVTIECLSDGEWSGQLNCAEPINQTGECDTDECDWQDGLYMALDDCQRFCQCAPLTTNADATTPGYWQEMVCGPETLFNPQVNVCDHPDNVDCEADSGFCGPAEIVGGTGDVTYEDNMATVTCHAPYEPTGPGTIECLSDGEWNGQLNCAEPTHHTGDCDTNECNWQDALYMPLDDCRRFCQCAPLITNADGTTPGYWQEMVCAPETLFNPRLNVCDHPDNVDCEAGSGGCSALPQVAGGTVIQTEIKATVWCLPPNVPTGPLTIECHDGEWSGQLNCAEPSSETGFCDATGATECNWQEDIYMANLGDCRRFCQCSPLTTNVDGTTTGYWQDMVCPTETLFNPRLNVCDHPDNVDCEAGTGTTPPPLETSPPHPTPTSDSGNGQCPTASCAIKTNLYDYMALPGCSSFCFCDYTDTWQLMTCPAGSSFDIGALTCRSTNDVNCNADVIVPFALCPTLDSGETCNMGDIAVYPGCSWFCICDITWHVSQCDGGTYTSPGTNDCSLATVPADQCLMFDDAPTPTDGPNPDVTTPDSGTPFNQCPELSTDETCKPDAYMALTGCKDFCHCDAAGVWLAKTCGEGTLFDTQTSNCIFETEVTCEFVDRPVEADCPPLDGTCVIGITAPLAGCTQYCECEHDHWTAMSCADGTYYSTMTTFCTETEPQADNCEGATNPLK